VTIPEGVTAIGDGAFRNSSVSNVVLPDSLTTIGSRAFSGAFLSSISIPANVMSIGERAFAVSNLQTIDFAPGSKLTSLGEGAFYGASNLLSVFIPKGVTTIANNTFYTS
jgi:hypothetical protein